MKPKSAIEQAAEAWRQSQLDIRAEDWKYKPAGVVEAFIAGARKLLELAEAHSYEHSEEGRPVSGFVYLSDLKKLVEEE